MSDMIPPSYPGINTGNTEIQSINTLGTNPGSVAGALSDGRPESMPTSGSGTPRPDTIPLSPEFGSDEKDLREFDLPGVLYGAEELRMRTVALNEAQKKDLAVVVRSFRLGPTYPNRVERRWAVETWGRRRDEHHVDFRPLKLKTGSGQIEYDKRRNGPSIVIGPHPEYNGIKSPVPIRAIIGIERCKGRVDSHRLKPQEIIPLLEAELPTPIDLQDSIAALIIYSKLPALTLLEDSALPQRLAFEASGLAVAVRQAKLAYDLDRENYNKKEDFEKAQRELEAKRKEIETLPDRIMALRYEILLEHMRIRNRHPEGMVIPDDLRWGMEQIGRLGDEKGLQEMIYGPAQSPSSNPNPTQSRSNSARAATGGSASGSNPTSGTGPSQTRQYQKPPFTASGPTQPPGVLPGDVTPVDLKSPEGRADAFRDPSVVNGMIRSFMGRTSAWQVSDSNGRLTFTNELRGLPSMTELEQVMSDYHQEGGQTPANAEKIYQAMIRFINDAEGKGYILG